MYSKCKETVTVDGKFSEWSAWSTCPVTCNGGPVTRSRLCDSPSPQFGGKPCEGETTQTSVCNTQLCPGRYLAVMNLTHYLYI